MRKPEEIQKEIDKLQEELKLSKEKHSRKLLWKESFASGDRIGFFDINKARVILTSLYDGDTLIFKHDGIGGEWKVWMNPQRNRILVNWIIDGIPSGDHLQVNENTIMSFIVWKSGDWYILNEEI